MLYPTWAQVTISSEAGRQLNLANNNTSSQSTVRQVVRKVSPADSTPPQAESAISWENNPLASLENGTLSQADSVFSQAGTSQASLAEGALPQSALSQAGIPQVSPAEGTLTQSVLSQAGISQASPAENTLSQPESALSRASNTQAVRCSARLRALQASQGECYLPGR